MKSQSWRRLATMWFLKPFRWIFYCFFQIDHFSTLCKKWKVEGYFWQLDSSSKRKRIWLTLRLLLPVLLCSFVNAFLWSLFWFVVNILLRSPLSFNDIPFLEARLVLPVVLLTFLGGISLGLARGITLGIIWSFILPLQNPFTPTEALLSFGVFGAFIFGSVFLSADIDGDITSSILWSWAVIFLWLGECTISWASWNWLEFVSSVKLAFLLLITNIVTRLLCRKWIMDNEVFASRNASSFGNVQGQAALIWLILWGGPLALNFSLVYVLRLFLAGSSYTARQYILGQSSRGLLISGFFYLFYIVGISRINVHPITLVSILLAYIRSKRHPERTYEYLQKSALSWNECIFLPLPTLRWMLSQILTEKGRVIYAVQLMQRTRQINALKRPLQDFLLRYLKEQNNCLDIARIHAFFSLLLPMSNEQVGNRQIIQLHHTKQASFVDFQFASPFAPFYNASLNVASALQEDWNLHRKKSTLQEAIQNLRKVSTHSRGLSSAQDQQLQDVVQHWQSIITAEYKRIDQLLDLHGRISNPFNPGSSSEDDSLFVGRIDLAFQLENALNSQEDDGPLLVFGSKRMGKTSLLKRLSSMLSTRYIPILYNLQDASLSTDETEFLYSMAKQIFVTLDNKYISIRNPDSDGIYLRMFECIHPSDRYKIFLNWIAQIQISLMNNQITLLLAFDEFENLTNKRKLDLQLLTTNLQKIMSTCSNIVLLFCGPRTKDELEPIWGDFLIEAQTFKVSYLQFHEAHALVLKANGDEATSMRYFDDSVVEAILEETACHPYLIQTICFSLINILNEKKQVHAHKADIALALDRSFGSVGLHFESLWKEASDQEQECLVELQKLRKATLDDLVNKAGKKSSVIRRAMSSLLKKDIVTYEQNVYRITVPMFVHWLERRAQ